MSYKIYHGVWYILYDILISFTSKSPRVNVDGLNVDGPKIVK